MLTLDKYKKLCDFLDSTRFELILEEDYPEDHFYARSYKTILKKGVVFGIAFRCSDEPILYFYKLGLPYIYNESPGYTKGDYILEFISLLSEDERAWVLFNLDLFM